ncbi:hypothetical protein LUZ60_000394 [Juncus effusus]|nr:hypothetical protein LUZ60_000394 [Juncus effusus]
MDQNNSSKTYKGSSIPSSWEEKADTIAYDSCTFPPPIILICGPGNTGKSIFSRLLLDTLLKRYEKVGYLDTDVGQPEFTTPGCVSFHIVENQTPDLTVLSLKTPERCFFFGNTCSKADAKGFLCYIFGLFDYFIKEYYQFENLDGPIKPIFPLIINTSGWIKGFGFDVLVEMLRYTSPTHVVKSRHSSANKNLPSGAFWLTSGENSTAEIIEICAAKSNTHSISGKNDARMMRDLRFLAYFRQCLSKNVNLKNYAELARQLASVPPFELSLSKIHVIHLNTKGLGGTSYRSLIGTLVGLAINSSVSCSDLISTPYCVGLGIVRAVDIIKDRIYLITPVSKNIMDQVDVILKGNIEIPSCLFEVADIVDGLADRIKQL